MIDRVKLVLLNEPLQMRELKCSHTHWSEQMGNSCGEVIEVGDLREYVIPDDQISPLSFGF